VAAPGPGPASIRRPAACGGEMRPTWQGSYSADRLAWVRSPGTRSLSCIRGHGRRTQWRCVKTIRALPVAQDVLLGDDRWATAPMADPVRLRRSRSRHRRGHSDRTRRRATHVRLLARSMRPGSHYFSGV